MKMMMDLQLANAAIQGDVEFLKEAFAREPPEYFLAQTVAGWSIFHHAAWNEKVEFLKGAMNILPTNILKQLLISVDDDSLTPLHTAVAYVGNISVIKCLREMYASLSWDDEDHVKPWLALNRSNKTPLNLSLGNSWADEECAMEIMLMDPEHDSWTIADKDGNTPLFYALKKGYNLVAERILKSPLGPTSLVGSTDFSTLFINDSDARNIVRLLKKCGYSDNDGNTPLHFALSSRSTEELALQTLSTNPGMRMICNDKGESPFFLAIKSGSEQVVESILRIEKPRFHMLRRYDGTTVLHCLSSCTEKTGLMLLEEYWWLIKLRDDQGKTALDYAKQEKTDWLVNLLTNPSLIKNKQDFDWEKACTRKESEAVLAFIDTCQDLQRVCRKGNDTLLHHVRLPTYEDYVKFLKIPSIAELKNNTTDRWGSTPLHSALKREDIHLAKALLLDDEVQQNIPDKLNRTAMDLLAKLCKEQDEWAKMFKLKVKNSYSYIKSGTNLEQVRNTLSVVAALLATITFAAGFTLPGGLKSDTGEALLAKKAAFLVFLLADVYAMCTSMLVLFSLIWSMVSEDDDMARLLVDRSVFLLKQSLYGTLLTFAASIYTVIAHSSLWAAILVLVMCLIIGISANNQTILYVVMAKLIPSAGKVKRYRVQKSEEELREIKIE